MNRPQKRWRLYPQQNEISQKLGDCLNVHPVVGQILLNRKITNLQSATVFLYPERLEAANFPQPNLDTMGGLIKEAILNNVPIMIYGDYDVDGMTSTAMMVSALKKLGATVYYYIPNRFTDGYGLSTSIIPLIQQENIGLLLTLDCGISNSKEIAEIKQQCKIKVGIFDHHKIPDHLPDAEAMINPQFLPESSPLSGLCTAGIVYQFLDFFIPYMESENTVDVTDYLDLCAIGTIADVAPLEGVNRILTKKGLLKCSKNPCVGVKALMQIAKCEKPQITVQDVGFMIAPRLNAAGRLRDAKVGVKLLLSEEQQDADQIAMILENMNMERRSIGEQMLKESKSALEGSQTFSEEKVIALEGKGWHAGVIGITASRLVDSYSKPTVLIATDDKIGRGSARSVGDVDLYQLLYQCKDYFETFGGHKQAAGFSILPEKINDFKKELKRISFEQLTPKQLMAIVDIDTKLTVQDLRRELYDELMLLEPFGERNPLPLFYMDNLKAIDFKAVGDGSHLKVTFSDQDERFFIDAIGFGLSYKIELL